MNYMEQIAGMLGVELGEHFDITNANGKIVTKDLWLTENGLRQKGMDDSVVLPHILNMLLVGDWNVHKRPQKAKLNEPYYFIVDNGDIEYSHWTDDISDFALYKLGKLYRTREEAEAHREEDTAFWQDIRMGMEG